MILQPATIRPAPDPQRRGLFDESVLWEPTPKWFGRVAIKRFEMPVEIEAKMKVESLDPVRTKLKNLGAEFFGEYLETNTFFDTDDRSLLAADEGLRLRVAKHVGEEIKPDEITLTYKGPRKHGQLKSRDETELKCSSPNDAAGFLKCLGYTRVMSFEKKRQSWKIEGCRIELDEIPHLGFYVEIEGTADEAVMKMREKLELGGRPIVRASYVALIMTYLQEHGHTDRVVKFPNGVKPATPVL